MGKKSSVDEHSGLAAISGKTPNQKQLINSIHASDIVVCTGFAGSGKTYICSSMAADWYKMQKKRRIIVTRPMVSNGDDIGFLPGNEEEKSVPWAHAPLDVIRQRVGSGKFDCDLGKSIIVKPLQMLQGASFDDAWVIVDEAQEMTVSQAKMIVTRIGVNSKLLINGDILQKNIKEESGLAYLIDLFMTKNINVPIIDFEIDDCQRSELCKTMLRAIYE